MEQARNGPDRRTCPGRPLLTRPEPPGRWLILADDLTGAADSAVAFARRGLSATVAWGDDPPDDAVLALDADSRRLAPKAAAARHRKGSTPEVSMMLVTPKLRVIHVTPHIGLLDAIRRIEPGLVERVIARGRDTLVKSGLAEPRIGVCGINPHAGENGLFGHGEEEEKISPAVQACQARGWAVDGPVKVLGLEAGVSITVGLRVVCTSVDHGTAFDIAGQGVADEGSLVEALRQLRTWPRAGAERPTLVSEILPCRPKTGLPQCC